MKITKFVHSCLLVETPDRCAIFDPGNRSVEALGGALDGGSITRLDDIFITHIHPDHGDPALIKRLVQQFPGARVTATPETVAALAKEGIRAGTEPPEGVVFFDSPHESVAPLFGRPPQEIGIHYLDKLSDPGDSHSFKETKAILALPVSAPWGSAIRALNLALELKPRHVLPIHDWHWHDEARRDTYGMFERVLGERGITFHKLETGQPVEIDI
jgi:L-ascorbate metabolism protein UlaG (beta-lactamase superfamily)